MYRVVIVDSDHEARRSLVNMMKWKSFDMEISGEAAEGVDAVTVIDRVRPELCIVDIEMHSMDGMDFVRIMSSRYPRMQILILTAARDFETVRRCVGLPLCGYIMKPAERTVMTDTLLGIRTRLREQHGMHSDAEAEPTAIEQIVAYIEKNYADPHINLTSTAQLFGFSASYLSRKFKQDTGRRFIEYLTECRMERARAMAEKGEKMFITAGAVGIPDPNYFGRCFKKYIGRSYSEYSSGQDSADGV